MIMGSWNIQHVCQIKFLKPSCAGNQSAFNAATDIILTTRKVKEQHLLQKFLRYMREPEWL